MKPGIEISDDKSRLDIDYIHNFLTNSYWAKGRTIDEMKTCIENSICFGVYLEGRQIGFARVLSDRVHFSYLMDVFIDDQFRGKGYAVELMSFILNDEKLKLTKIWRLATADAHGLYRKFGFKELEKPENMMERKKQLG